jgi:hypothetical protein
MDYNRFRRWAFWLGIAAVVLLVGVVHVAGVRLGVFR